MTPAVDLDAVAPRNGQKYDPVTRAVFAVVFSCALIQGTFGGLLPFISADLKMSHTVESLHIMAMSLGGMVFSLVAEPLRLRAGRLNTLGLALLLGILGATSLAVATNPVMSVASLFLLGAAMGSVLIIGQNLLVVVHHSRSARMIGEFNVVFSIAALLSILALPFLAQSVFGWRAYPGLQILASLALALPLLLVAIRSRDRITEPAAPKDVNPARAHTGRLNIRPITSMALAVALEWSLIFWTALFLIDVAGISAAQGAVATAVMLSAVLVGRIAGSVLLERLGPWRILMTAFALAVLTLVFMLGATTPLSAYVAAALAGLTAANIYPASISLVLQSNPHARDLAVARASFFSTIATVSWPLCLGLIADQVGLSNAIYFLFALIAIAVGALFWAKPPKPLVPNTAGVGQQ